MLPTLDTPTRSFKMTSSLEFFLVISTALDLLIYLTHTHTHTELDLPQIDYSSMTSTQI